MSDKGGPLDLYDLIDLLEEGGDSFGWIVAHGDQATIDDVWARTSSGGTIAEAYDWIYPRDVAWRTELARAYGVVLTQIFGTGAGTARVREIVAVLSIRSARKRREQLAEIAARSGKHDRVSGPLELTISRLAYLGSMDDGIEWGTSIAELSTSAIIAVAKTYLDEQWNFDKGFADYVRSVTPPPRIQDIVARLESVPRRNPSARRGIRPHKQRATSKPRKTRKRRNSSR